MEGATPYTSLEPGQWPAEWRAPLPGPWAAAGGRVFHAAHVRAGAPPGLSTSRRGALAAFPACLVARAVLPGTGSGTEVLGEGPLDLQGLARAVVVLTHGGPRMADIQRDRPVGPAEVADPLTGRTPRALAPEEWTALHRAWVDEGGRALAAGAWGVGVEAARGQLWHAALSPLTGGGAPGLARLCALVTDLRALSDRVLVSLCVEDVAVGGLHAGAGVEHARALVAAGATALVVRTGSAWNAARLVPPPPRFPHEEGPALHAAAWTRHALASAAGAPPGRARLLPSPWERVPVLVAGALQSVETISAALARACDGVCVESWE
ncbi:MAG: hypothetical protein HY904_16740 [Deltaproteobacteria bacterium]|nr:hypothetical protein [Deltaproteobacteria bacterium]